MLVAITGFGSVWRCRLGKPADNPERLWRMAYYNTTGVMVHGSVRQRPKIVGYARFNAAGGFNPNYPSRMINRVFQCADPCVWNGANKLLFERMLPHGETPDLFLVVVRPELTGTLTVGPGEWRSSDTWLLSFSEAANQQEAMLLMPANGWIRGELGRFVLELSSRRPWIARLVLTAPQ
jgi:hypothetical protein